MTKTQRVTHRGAFRQCAQGHRTKAVKWVAVLLVLASPLSALAQTWAGNRQRPSLREIATVDATGEANWLWGQEDVAGNGLNQFPAAEQAIDARSVYLRVDGNRLWWRTYLSGTVAPTANLTAYLFIDADLNPGTGRSAAALELDAAFTADPSLGGYEYVLSVRGDGTQPTLWETNATATAFVEVPVAGNAMDGESDAILDPLRVGEDVHGYVQLSIADNLVGLTAQCQARFYVRTTNQTQGLGVGDLDVGEPVACVSLDTNANRVPDVLEPATLDCVTNAQCANGGVCWHNRCWLAAVCLDNADCPANSTCINGSCIVSGGTNCTTNGDCASGFCQSGRCAVCTSDSACGTGRICGPDGRCINENAAGPSAGGTGNVPQNTAGTDGIVLAPGERIQGGSCACRAAAIGANRQSAAWLVVAAGLALRRVRRRGERRPSR